MSFYHGIKNKHNKFFIMLELNTIYVRSNTRYSSHCKGENRLAVYVIFGAQACFDRLEYIERVQFVLQNCEILHSVRGLYDKNSTS